MIRPLIRRAFCQRGIIRLNWSVYPVQLSLLHVASLNTANCTDTPLSVYPVSTGYTGDLASVHPVLLVFAELVHLNLSLCSFFIFCFDMAFYFFLGT